MEKSRFSGLEKEKIKRLLYGRTNHSGRNRSGVITVRHIGGTHKRVGRLIDTRRSLFGEQAVITRIEFDPNRGGYIGLLYYLGVGLFSYMLLPDGLKVGSVIGSYRVPQTPFVQSKFLGSSFMLQDIPLSVPIYNLEVRPGGGGQLVKAAGTFAKIVRKFKHFGLKGFVGVRLPSGKSIFLPRGCIASVGQTSNMWLKLSKLGIAGRSTRLGRRPSVRGVAMNPVDHPHGGGEGKTSGGRPSVSKWGWLTKGPKSGSKKRKIHKVELYKKINKRYK